jgi:hypothetical protein
MSEAAQQATMVEAMTTREIADMITKTTRAVEMRAKKESWPYISEPGNGRGGKTRKYLVTGFPPDVQSKYLEAHPLIYKEGGNGDGGHPSPQAPDPEPLPPALYNKDKAVTIRDIIPAVAGVSADPWQMLPESCRDKGYDILLIVNRVREILAKTPRKRKTPALREYAESIDCNYRTLYRYLQKADKALKSAQAAGQDTIMAQIRALSHQHGRSRDRVVAFDRDAIVYALSLYGSGEMRTMKAVFTQTQALAGARHWQMGTYPALCRHLKRLDQATATLAREGKKAFEAVHLVKTLRDYNEIWPNFMWCGDHHIFDVFVKIPDGKGGWHFKRPWLTSSMDMRSRSFMGWCISFKPDSRTIAMALAHGIAPKNDPAFPQCGIPSSVYIDNGKDYRAKYLGGEEIEIGRIDYPVIMERFASLGIDPFYIDLEFDPQQNAWVKKHGDRYIEIKGVRVGGVYARLGIGQRYATAYHPWAKPIERAHRTIVQSFSRECPGWCGSGHEQRPEKLTFELKGGHVLTMEDFCDRFYNWVVNVYHTTPHRGHGMDGRSPNEVFTSLLPQPKTCDPALLDFALLKKDRVKMHNWGFHLDGRKYQPDLPVNLQGGRILNILIGSWAMVFYDYDYKTIRIYLNGKYVCSARPLDRASFVTPSDPVMVDNLKLASYQKRAATGILRRIHGDDAVQPAQDEAAALLAITQGEPAALPAMEADPAAQATAGVDGATDKADASASATPSKAQRDPDDDVIPLTQDERYKLILRRLAKGRELSAEDLAFKESFEQSQIYQESRALYEAEFEYQKYLIGGKS